MERFPQHDLIEGSAHPDYKSSHNYRYHGSLSDLSRDLRGAGHFREQQRRISQSERWAHHRLSRAVRMILHQPVQVRACQSQDVVSMPGLFRQRFCHRIHNYLYPLLRQCMSSKYARIFRVIREYTLELMSSALPN